MKLDNSGIILLLLLYGSRDRRSRFQFAQRRIWIHGSPSFWKIGLARNLISQDFFESTSTNFSQHSRSAIVFCAPSGKTPWTLSSGRPRNRRRELSQKINSQFRSRKKKCIDLTYISSSLFKFVVGFFHSSRKRVAFPYLAFHFLLACVYVFLHAGLVLLQVMLLQTIFLSLTHPHFPWKFECPSDLNI